MRLLRSTKASLHDADNRAHRTENENGRLMKDLEESQRWNLRVAMPCLKDYERYDLDGCTSTIFDLLPSTIFVLWMYPVQYLTCSQHNI